MRSQFPVVGIPDLPFLLIFSEDFRGFFLISKRQKKKLLKKTWIHCVGISLEFSLVGGYFLEFSLPHLYHNSCFYRWEFDVVLCPFFFFFGTFNPKNSPFLWKIPSAFGLAAKIWLFGIFLNENFGNFGGILREFGLGKVKPPFHASSFWDWHRFSCPNLDFPHFFPKKFPLEEQKKPNFPWISPLDH